MLEDPTSRIAKPIADHRPDVADVADAADLAVVVDYRS
jgi:hypothetical protein